MQNVKSAMIQQNARYEEDEEGGAYYIGDDDKPCASYGIFVNAWAELPKPYRDKEEVMEEWYHVKIAKNVQKSAMRNATGIKHGKKNMKRFDRNAQSIWKGIGLT